VFFIERLAGNGSTLAKEYGAVFTDVFVRIQSLPESEFFLFVSSYYSLKKMGTHLLSSRPVDFDVASYCSLLQRSLGATYEYWAGLEDPQQWFHEQAGEWWDPEVHPAVFSPVSHERLRELAGELAEIGRRQPEVEKIKPLTDLPGFMDIVQYYRKLPDMLGQDNPYPKILMLYKIMETKGLESIHQDVLGEINTSLSRMIREGSAEVLISFLSRTFSVLKRSKKLYPESGLTCLLTIGREVFKTQSDRLIDHFLNLTIGLGFEPPGVRGVSADWQVLSNPVHVYNIRIWLELIKLNPERCSYLLSALLVNLSLGGVCIRDTDLFQKDISRLLNSPIGPVYNLVKQLAKIFPVYFNEIGAEGRLRDVSTEIDELSHRRDLLIHFLRKLSHVESNNLILDFISAIIDFWRTKDRTPLQPFVPEEVFQQIVENGPYIDEVHEVLQFLFRENGLSGQRDLLELDPDQIAAQLGSHPPVSEGEKRRTLLLIEFYRLLVQKYELGIQGMVNHLQQGDRLGLPDPQDLIKALTTGKTYDKLDAILGYLETLREIILSEQQSTGVENIYRKRHIAADIPSMYGSYQERKFDALGLTFRLEKLANTLLEEIVARMNLGFITRATFFRINRYMGFFVRALELEGITSGRLDKQLELFGKALEIRRFSHSQYLDIFRGFSQAIKQIISRHYHQMHQDNLAVIIDQLGHQLVLDRYQKGEKSKGSGEFINKVSETFLRDLVASTFGLQTLDNLISRILTTLNKQREVLNTEHLDLLMSYDPEKVISGIHRPHYLTQDPIHLGNKGYNLVRLAEYGIPVPPGFIVTTEVFRCRQVFKELDASYRDFLIRVEQRVERLEAVTGCRYGSASMPLLLSVRSGAPISMPGMMNTFLNLGINEAIVEGLIRETGEAWFAWDSYRRFLQSWGMAFGMERDEFDLVMKGHKERYQRQFKRQFTMEEIRELTRAYRRALEERGVRVVDEPMEQLHTAITQVMRSWYSRKAGAYREIMGISENWGTGVTIQAMVYGNLDTNSGAGVAFTHNPRKMDDRIQLWGDFTLGNQGEDVVSGLVKTLPLSEEQKLAEGRDPEISLESRFPHIFGRLREIGEKLITEHGWGPQEIEFTFQGKREDGLFILQTRDMQHRVHRSFSIFVPSARLKKAYLAGGIGVSGGALSGIAVFNLEEIERYRNERPGEALILVRSDTVPDDIKEISASDGILSARGGATSHAAIVAHRLGKTCVVGCLHLQVWEAESRCLLNKQAIGGGDFLSIDGRSGAIYKGKHRTETAEVYQE
jgi:pyruvate,orthophosphate dikinase